MIKYLLDKLMPPLILIIFLLISFDPLMADDVNYSISKPKVFKRNKASCSRLGNVYDACQWMTKVSVKNLGNKKITQLCLLMKVNKKTYELCYGKTKKLLIKKNTEKT